MKRIIIILLLVGISLSLFGCPEVINPPIKYLVTYNGNGSTSGTAPIDSGSPYLLGSSVTVMTRGSLVRTGYSFAGWNTAANGTGMSLTENSTFTLGAANRILYAMWSILPTYTVSYNGNGNTGGAAPTDPSSPYIQGATVTVQTQGSLVRTGYSFSSWNTAANGSGTSYTASSTFTMGSANVILYAHWTALPTYTVSYDGNGHTGGSVPVDDNQYPTGASVTVLENTGLLVKTGFVFAGWNTAANGGGADRTAGSTFSMGSVNVILYAKWDYESLNMVPIPGGIFHMGMVGITTPVHQVSLTGFRIGKYEVTQAQYLSVTGTAPSHFDGIDLPVELVTWYDAVEFCNKLSVNDGFLPVYTITWRTPTIGYPITSATVTMDMAKNGYRLPTEAEWEYAARGGNGSPDNYTYSGSNDIGTVAWYSDNSGSTTHTVGTKKANNLGLYDMTGNVWEWCQDWYSIYESDAQTDPQGPSSGTYRVYRGGSWDYFADGCRSAHRTYFYPYSRSNYIGFRVARRM